MRIFVVRHGESEDDLSDSYGGAANFHLTDHGRAQALATAQDLKGEGIDGIYSSPLFRALESAEIIGNELAGPEVVTVPELRERNTYGVLSGHTREKAENLFGYILDSLPYRPGEWPHCMPGGEEFGPFIERVRVGFESVVQMATEGNQECPLVVTHGKFTLALFSVVLGLGEEYESGHGSINVIEYSIPKYVR